MILDATATRLRRLMAAAVAAAVAGVVLLSIPAESAQAAPFTCSSAFYWVQNAQLFTGSPLTTPFGKAVGPANASGQYNALGYNQQDGLLYAIGSSGTINQQLVSIDDTGTVTAHGIPTGLPNGTWNSGGMDDAGNLWVADSSSATLYKINVSTNTAQTFEPTPSATASYSADMVWHVGTVVRLAVSSSSTIRVFNLATGTWTSTPVTVSALTVLGAPAMWITDSGRLFIGSRSGAIADIVGWQSPTPSYVRLLPNGVAATNGDGASCAQAAPPVGVTANDDNYSSTPILASQGGSTGNIWGNDTLNLATPPAGSITTAVTDDGLTGVTIGNDGSVIVPSGLRAGTYHVGCQICSVAIPAECSTALVTLALTADSAGAPAFPPKPLTVLTTLSAR